MQIQATLCHKQLSLPWLALVDSSAEQSFLDRNLVFQASISAEPPDTNMKVSALDGNSWLLSPNLVARSLRQPP